MQSVASWDGSAEIYDRYCRRHDTYRATSAHLVSMIPTQEPAPERIVDLACGTGATGIEIIRRFGPGVAVTCVDRSPDMIAIAKSSPQLARAEFLDTPAESLDLHLESGVDVVFCNSAFWLMNMPAVLRSAGKLLRPGGKFVFNCPAYVLNDRDDPGAMAAMPELMTACLAQRKSAGLDRRPASSANGKGSSDGQVYALSTAAIARMGSLTGFAIVDRTYFEIIESNTTTFEAMEIPAILSSCFPGIAAHEAAVLLERAFATLDPRKENVVGWHAFVLATRDVP
jgi:SAM-dependent methyltransferase